MEDNACNDVFPGHSLVSARGCSVQVSQCKPWNKDADTGIWVSFNLPSDLYPFKVSCLHF